MAQMSIAELTERLELVDQLYFGRNEMLEPQDLPGRYGRAIKAIDHLAEITKCPTVVTWKKFTLTMRQSLRCGLRSP